MNEETSESINELNKRLKKLERKLSDLKSISEHYEILKKDNDYLQKKLVRLQLDNEDMESRLHELICGQTSEEMDLFLFGNDIDMRVENRELIPNDRTSLESDSNDHLADHRATEQKILLKTERTEVDDLNSEETSDVPISEIDDFIENFKVVKAADKSVNDENATNNTSQVASKALNVVKSNEMHLLIGENQRLEREIERYQLMCEEYRNKYNKCERKLKQIDKYKSKYKSIKKERNELKEIERDHDEYIHELKFELSALGSKREELCLPRTRDCCEHLRLIADLESEIAKLSKIHAKEMNGLKRSEIILRLKLEEQAKKLSLINECNGQCKNCVKFKCEKEKYEDLYKKTVELLVYESTK